MSRKPVTVGIACLFAALFFSLPAPASSPPATIHAGHEVMAADKGQGPMNGAHDHDAVLQAQAQSQGEVGLEEKLGASLPQDLIFRDEGGHSVRLSDLLDRPTVIAPIYFKCPNVCNFLQTSLVEALPQVKMTPEKDFQVLSVSFDETEGPEIALRSKKAYYHALNRDYPDAAWRFLTGDLETIRGLTDAIGFNFRREGADFLHPVTLVVAAPGGKVVRYLHGTHILPMDLNLALIEAGEGRVSPPIRKMLTFCFSYDPEGKRYVFNLLRVTATGVILAAGSLFLYLILSGRRKDKR